MLLTRHETQVNGTYLTSQLIQFALICFNLFILLEIQILYNTAKSASHRPYPSISKPINDCMIEGVVS